MKTAIRITRVRPTKKRKWKGAFVWSVFTVAGFVYRVVSVGAKVLKFVIDFFDSGS